MKFIFTLLGLLVFLPFLRADMAPLISTKQVLGNGKFLLVMLYPLENTLNKENPLNKQYPQSGLYPNDGSNKPIWTLPHPFQGQVFLSGDGEYLANVVFPAEFKGDGVHFYHKGKLLRAYKIEELTRPDSIQNACPSCIWHGSVDFREAELALQVEARDGRIWRFDLRTGKAVLQGGPGQAAQENAHFPEGGLGAVWIVLILLVVVLALSMGGFLLWWSGVLGKSRLESNE